MTQPTLLTSSILGGLMAVLGATAGLAESEPVGVLGLYRGDTTGFDSSKIADLGCTIQREGVIGAAQGNLDLEQPNQFLLLACEASVLGEAARRSQFASIAGPDHVPVVLEGDLTDFDVPDAVGEISDRQYILKVSTYNNANVDERETELASLNATAEQRVDTYKTESFVSVNHAMGMPTPDEVVVLYYDTPASGDRFRDQNGDLMNSIGAFNKAHLVNFVYYVGQASQ